MQLDDVSRAKAQYLALLERLRAAYPDQSDDDLTDTLDGMTDITDMLARIVRSTETDEALLAGIDVRINVLKERSNRIHERRDAKRAFVADMMQEIGRQKIECPDMTISLSRRSGKVILIDEALIPREFMRQPDPPAPKPLLNAIKAVLDEGREVPGCTLGNGSVGITVRTR